MNISVKSLDLLKFCGGGRQLLELITKCPRICVKHSNICVYSSYKMTTALRLKHNVSRTSSLFSIADSSPRLKTVQEKDTLISRYSSNTKSRNDLACVPNVIKHVVKSDHLFFRNYTLDSSPYCNLLFGHFFNANCSQYRYFHRLTHPYLCKDTSKDNSLSQSSKTLNKNTKNENTSDVDKSEDVDIAKQFVEKNSHNNSEEPRNNKEEPPEKLSIFSRFKKTYKEHGKVLGIVHFVIGMPFWYGLCYTIAYCGLDVVPLLEYLNLPDSYIKPFKSGHMGNVAIMLLLVKLLTPIRYSASVYGTRMVVKYMQKSGRLKPVPKENSLKSLATESSVIMKSRSTVHYNKANKRVRTSISRAKTGITKARSDFNRRYRRRGKQNRD